MTPSLDTELSSCCRAPMIVVGDSFGEGTNHYECTKCGNACDRAIIKPKPAMRYVDEDGYQDVPKSISPTENTEELKKALKKDFHALYVRGFTNDWTNVRFVRDIEIDIMPLHNLEAFIASREHQAVQAFGEKVLKNEMPKKYDESQTGDRFIEGYNLAIDNVVSAITSLMGKGK